MYNAFTVPYYQSMLDTIPNPTSYDEALRVGMALRELGWGGPAFNMWWNWYEGSREGLSNSGKTRAELAAQWESFRREKGRKVHPGTLVKMAEAYGWTPPLNLPDPQLMSPEELVGGPPATTTDLSDIAVPFNAAATPSARGVITRRASQIQPRGVEWIWPGHIARGKFGLLAGVPGTNKTTLLLAAAAIVSTGGTWPDGTYSPVGNVLIWSGEDEADDTLVPRLIRMGANLDRIEFIEGMEIGGIKREFDPSIDMPGLIAKAKTVEGGVALFIIDPVVSVLPVTRDSHKNAEARNGMQPLVSYAKVTRAAVLGITHLTKFTEGKDPLERLTGSGAFGALPRFVLFAAHDKARGPDARVLVRVKTSLDRPGGGFNYHVDTAPLYTGQTSRPCASFGTKNLKATRVTYWPRLKAGRRIVAGRRETRLSSSPAHWQRESNQRRGSSRTLSPSTNLCQSGRSNEPPRIWGSSSVRMGTVAPGCGLCQARGRQ